MPRGDRVEVHHARTNDLNVSVSLDGVRFHVQDIGLGHWPHTICDGAGRPSTDAEVALAEALAKAVTQTETERRANTSMPDVCGTCGGTADPRADTFCAACSPAPADVPLPQTPTQTTLNEDSQSKDLDSLGQIWNAETDEPSPDDTGAVDDQLPDDAMQVSIDHEACPTCGSAVVAVSGDEGTSHYRPVDQATVLVDQARAENVRLKAERDRAIETRENANRVSVRVEIENKHLRLAGERLLRAYEAEESEHGFPFNFELRDAHRALKTLLG